MWKEPKKPWVLYLERPLNQEIVTLPAAAFILTPHLSLAPISPFQRSYPCWHCELGLTLWSLILIPSSFCIPRKCTLNKGNDPGREVLRFLPLPGNKKLDLSKGILKIYPLLWDRRVPISIRHVCSVPLPVAPEDPWGLYLLVTDFSGFSGRWRGKDWVLNSQSSTRRTCWKAMGCRARTTSKGSNGHAARFWNWRLTLFSLSSLHVFLSQNCQCCCCCHWFLEPRRIGVSLPTQMPISDIKLGGAGYGLGPLTSWEGRRLILQVRLKDGLLEIRKSVLPL